MIEYEYYDWNKLISQTHREQLVSDVKSLIQNGQYWKNSPRYQTNVNVFGLPREEWVNLKMSFIWSCFAYLKKDVQIKSIKSWSYMTSLKYTTEDRQSYWHQHIREGSKVISGVYYLKMPSGVDSLTAGTEFSPNGPENTEDKFFVEAKEGQWVIWPGTAWHRPGILQSHEDRFIIAADMEF